MTLEQLRVFIEVAKLQHIRKASESLNLTQSAVSSSVKTLEERYNVKLFDRVGRSIILNRAGVSFLVEALKIQSAAKAGEAMLVDLSELKSGDLSIMASRTVGAYWLPQRLTKFRAQFPSIKLHISMGNSDEVAEAVQNGQADIGFVEQPDNLLSLTRREVASDELIVVVSPGHPWADQEMPINSLLHTRWILRERGSGTRRIFDQLMQREGISPSAIKVHMELPDNQAILSALHWDEAATLISRSAVSNALANGNVKLAKITPLQRSYFLLRNDLRYQSKASEAFQASVCS